MSRLGKGLIAAAGGAVVLLAALALLRSGGAGDVATITVARTRFVRKVSATGMLRAAKTTPVTAPIESMRSQKIATLVPDGSRVQAGDVVVRFDPYDARKEADDGHADAASAGAKFTRAQADGDKDTHGRVLDRDLAREDLKRAEEFVLTDEGIFSRNQRVESEIDRDLQSERVSNTTAMVDAGGRLVASSRELADIQKDKAALKVRQAEQSLHSLEVVAPHAGLFVYQRDWRGDPPRAGQSFWPGQKIGEIPDLASLEALVWVLESDASGLKADVHGTLVVEGRPGWQTDVTVSRVEALARPRQSESPVRYFETTLALGRTESWATPGQFVRADLRLEERDDVIAVPRSAVFDRDGQRIAYRLRGGRFAAVPVVVGANSASRVVVEKGLEPGDRIALRDPSAGAGGPASPPPVAAATAAENGP